MKQTNGRKVSFAPAAAEVDEIQPARAPSAISAAASAVSSAQRPQKRKRGANGGADGRPGLGNASDDSDDADGGAQGVAHASSLVHDADAGTAVTAFNLDDELQDGAIDQETGAFVPSELRRAAAASPTHSVSSSDEEERVASEAAKIRAAEARAPEDDEPDDWVAHEEDASRPAPAYAAPFGGGSGGAGGGAGSGETAVPAVKRPRALDAVTASSPAAEKTEAELVMSLGAVLEDGETAGGAIRRLKRAADMPQLETVTELADGLMGLGVLSAYDLRRRDVLARASWTLSWGKTSGVGALHGPFTVEKMQAWAEAGFFSHPTKIGWVRAAPSCPWVLASSVFRRNELDDDSGR